jgi:DNA-binding response OmpR family regulator
MKQKILIAEDDVFLSKIYKIHLKDEFRLIIAKDGEEAIAKIKSSKPDLIILDIVMPKKSGIEVIEEIKNDPETKDIPIIVISNLGQDNDVQKALDLGANDYLIKAQISFDDAFSKVKALLKASSS